MERSKRDAGGHDMQIKLLTVGDSGVGKTSLLLRYANGSFSSTFITTIGIDFKINTIKLDDKRIKLQIWDTAGQERFRTITKSYFRGAQGILLVFDVTDRSTFNSVETWVEDIAQNADRHVNKILIGNKCDLEGSRVVKRSDAEALAERFKMPYFECSAKLNLSVDEAFRELARLVVQREAREGGPRDPSTATPVVKIGGGKTSRSCCGKS